jgi:anti-sigma regulatory factor (Ser/Thr protein kinase)
MMYAGDDQLVAALSAFVAEGVAADVPTLVVLASPKLDRLRAELGPQARQVEFADMNEVGSNPARILSRWQDFVEVHGPGARLRGVGEPVTPGRSQAELVECRLHESLLNVAFGEGTDLELLCPYDTSRLDPFVVSDATRTHPIIDQAGDDELSHSYNGGEEAARIFAEPLPRPGVSPAELRFTRGPLHHFRRFVARHASDAGLANQRLDDMVLAANEIASNSIHHGGGSGIAAAWSDEGTFFCEIRDAGHIYDQLVGRRRPSRGVEGGRGMWMANQLCDLVQVRSSSVGTVVRLHMRLEARA